MRHSAVFVFEAKAGRQYKDTFIDMLPWQMLFEVEDGRASVFVGPRVTLALRPFTITFDIAFLNSNGNAYKDSSASLTECSFQHDQPDITLKGWRNNWNFHTLRRQDDGTIHIRLKVKDVVTSHPVSMAVLHHFTAGAKLDMSLVKTLQIKEAECEEKEKLIGDLLERQEKEKLLAKERETLGKALALREASSKVSPEPQTIVESPTPFDLKTHLEDVEKRGDPEEMERVLGILREGVTLLEKRRKEARACVICLEGERQIVCLPCRHMVTCVACMTTLKEREGGAAKCPTCRATINDTLNPFL